MLKPTQGRMEDLINGLWKIETSNKEEIHRAVNLLKNSLIIALREIVVLDLEIGTLKSEIQRVGLIAGVPPPGIIG